MLRLIKLLRAMEQFGSFILRPNHQNLQTIKVKAINSSRSPIRKHVASSCMLTLCLPWLLCIYFGFFIPNQVQAQIPPEDCSNGIDDDGDGLIDCYDPDCNCTSGCADFYYQECNEDCFYIPPCDQINLGVDWTGTAETGSYSTLVAGDMDADGIPDVIAYNVESTELYIIDGATGTTKVTIQSPKELRGGTAPAIADLDQDGFGEIIIVAKDRNMRCYEHDGTLKWTTTAKVGYDYTYNFSVPSIADFDGNNSAEILVGNEVYNGQTGALIGGAGANFSAGEHVFRKQKGFSFNSSVAMDVLPDAFCADCEGLEIVAGNQVFSVNETTGTVALQSSAPAGYQDGYTAVVDFDRDGDMDAVVQGQKNGWNTTYVWDCQSGIVTREFRHLNNWKDGASRTNISDLNGDGQLEVSFVSYPWFYALNNNFQIMWKNTNDDVSSITSSSVFDFCGDGSADIVYRGQKKLQIIEGSTGIVKWEDDCTSATHIETPLILDVDADGQTEIVILCGRTSANGQNGGTVVAYEATNTAAISSRKVWNQHAYISTNINDDLSVPVHQQNPSIVGDGLKLNGFMNQYFNPTFPSPDGIVSIESVTCVGDSLDIEVTIDNAGAAVLPAQTPVSFYKGNPTQMAAQWLGSLPMTFALQRNSTRTTTWRIPRVANDSIFIVLNDNSTVAAPFNLVSDFPSTNIGECLFDNNMAGFYYSYNPDLLDIGVDTMICHSASLDLAADGTDYTDWLWEDGSTDIMRSNLAIGQYEVTVTDICGITQTDSRLIEYDSSTIVQLGIDQEICEGDGVILSQPGFDTYTWSPSTAVDCDDCFFVTAIPNVSTPIILEAQLNNGCFSRDTVDFEVHPRFNIVKDTTVCFGLDVLWDGVAVQTENEHTFTYQSQYGCDSIFTLRVAGTSLGTYQVQADTNVCLGTSVDINGLAMIAGQTRTFDLTAVTGCDSTVTVSAMPLDTFATAENPKICFGESMMIFGQSQSTSGIYKQKFTAENGCDSTHTVELLVLPAIQIDVDATPTCLNETSGILDVNVSGGSSPYNFAWTPAVSTTNLAQNLEAGDYELSISDAEGCTLVETQTVDAFPAMQYDLDVDSVRCFGENNGAISITTADPSLLVAFDEGAFSQEFDFGNLEPGIYPVTLQDEYGCEEYEDVSVHEPDPIVVELIGENQVNLGDSVQIEVLTNAAPNVTYTWSPPLYLSCDTCPEPFVKPTSSIKYDLMVQDENGCEASTQFLLAVKRVVDIYVPNAFSPYASIDVNSRLKPEFGSAISTVKAFRIFDRWGNQVHEVLDRSPEDMDLAWDGNFNNRRAASETYVWQLELLMADGLVETVWGDVSVVR